MDLSGDEVPVAHDPGPDHGLHGLADERRDELLVPCHLQADGTAVGLQRQRAGQPLREAADLAPEGAPDVHGDDPDVALGKAQAFGHVLPGEVQALGAAPDVELPLGVELGDADVGLHADVLDHRDFVRALDDEVRFFQALVDVPLANPREVGDVRSGLLDQDVLVVIVFAQIRVDEDRVGLQGFIRVEQHR